MDNRKFKSRTEKRLMRFVNGNSEYVRSDTLENCKILIDFFKKDFMDIGKRRRMCITEVSQKTGLRNDSISSALHIICYREKPVLRMFGWGKLPERGGKIRTMTMIQLRKPRPQVTDSNAY